MKLNLKKFCVSYTFAFLGCGFLLADPGELFAKRKAEIMKKYDVNHDGRLDVRERLVMREEILKEKKEGKGDSGRGRGMIPPELIEAFDKNKDGDLDEAEQKEMNADIRKRFGDMVENYDQNSDGELKGQELSGLREASKKGTLKGLDAFVARFLLMGNGRGEGGEENDDGDLSRFDRDGDGLASVDELEAIRNQEPKP